MSQQIPSPRGGASGGHRNGTDVRHDLWVPTLVRALVALVFGAVTIFWQEPTENAAPWALGLFLVGTGGAWLFLHFRMKGREDVDLGSLTNIPQLAGILYILGGALVAIMAPQNCCSCCWPPWCSVSAAFSNSPWACDSARVSRSAGTGPSAVW